MIEGVFRAISLQTGYGDCRDFDPDCPQWAEEGHCSRAKAFLLRGHKDNGKEHGDYYIVYWGYIRMMEKKMETAIWGLGFRA